MILDPNECDDQAIYHEMLHVLGMLHEQQRPDRDEYVTVHYKNIPYSFDKQFKKLKKAKTLDLPYDFRSIMHYTTFQGTGYPNESTITLNVSTFLKKNGFLVTTFYDFIVKSVGKFFSYQYMLGTAVTCHLLFIWYVWGHSFST